MADRAVLIGRFTPELEQIAVELGHKSFRGRQLSKWIYEKATRSFDEMLDLPKQFREQLAEKYVISPLYLAQHRTSTDEVEKLLVHNGDDQVYECVLLPYENRVSCCISSQVGCPMGCTFCATGMEDVATCHRCTHRLRFVCLWVNRSRFLLDNIGATQLCAMFLNVF